MHWCLVTIRTWSFWCTTATSVILHSVSIIENSWICTIVINATKSTKLMEHCYHDWLFDVKKLSVPQFQKDEIECMIYDVYVNWSWYFMVMYLFMSEYILFHARLPCMNDWLLYYLNLFILLCSSFFVYWDLLNPNKLLNWIYHGYMQFASA